MATRAAFAGRLLAKLRTPSDLVQRVGWTSGAYAITQVIRFGSSLILTRLLTPDLFGVMTLLLTLRVGLELFTDLGIGQSVISSKNAREPDFYNTAWTLQILRGIFLTLLALALTPVLTAFYGQESLQSLLPYFSLFFIIAGLQSIGVPLALKDFQNKRYAFYEVAVAVLGVGIIILSVLVSPDITGLLAGNLLASALQVVCSYFLLPGIRHALVIRRAHVFEIIKLGKWIFLVSILYFLAMNFDRLVLAKYVPFAALGIYGLAKSLCDVPSQLSAKLGASIIFPSVAALTISAQEMRAKLARRRWQFLVVSAGGLAILISQSDLIVRVLYDNRYLSAGAILPWVAVATWVGMMSSLNENVLLGLGKPAYLTAANSAKLVGLLLLLPYAVVHYGIAGAAIATLVSECLRYAASSGGQWHQKIGFLRQDLLATMLLAVMVIALRALTGALGLTGSLDTLFLLNIPAP